MEGLFDGRGQHEGGKTLPNFPFSVSREAGPVPAIHGEASVEVLWSGHVYGLSGYAKANRELILRLANNMVVALEPDTSPELGDADQYTKARIDVHRRVMVSDSAPMVRFFTPKPEEERKGRHMICYTMMETQEIHPEFVRRLNANYDEVWTPTRWNADAFHRAGLKLPCFVMPLGVNPQVFRPAEKRPMPVSMLMTTDNAGIEEVPKGFLFICVFQPTFRKGIDVLVRAWDTAFKDDPDAALVLATTYNAAVDPTIELPNFAMKSRIYVLNGRFTEAEMARIYNSCDAYVSTSRGEGWNLPMTEAAACGLPVVAPRHTAHLEFASDGNAWIFDQEGQEPWPEASEICPFYEEIPFARYGEKTNEQLAGLLREVKAKKEGSQRRAHRLTDLIRTRYTWDAGALRIFQRLREVSR